MNLSSFALKHIAKGYKPVILFAFFILFFSTNAICQKPDGVSPQKDIADTSKVYFTVEQSAAFQGGESAFYHFLTITMRYPAAAREKNVQGNVLVTFIVEKDGSLSNIRILRGIGNGCDEEAVRVFKLSPKWIPGKHNGVPVRQQFTVPVAFSLKN